MKSIRFVAGFALLALFALSIAQAQDRNLMNLVPKPNKAHAPAPAIKQSAPVAKSAADSCAYTFTSTGNGNNSYMEFCVSVNGNIISFQSPDGIEYLDLGTLSEGYGVCDESTGATYYDYADYGASGFGTATTLSSSATSVKIARTTNDGAWTLTQIITKVGGGTGAGESPYAKIEMQLKNNSGVEKEALLLRWADVDPYDANETLSFTESFDSTYNSAWGYTNYYNSYNGDYNGYGLMIQNIGNPTTTPAGEYYFYAVNWDINSAPGSPFNASSVCDPFYYWSGPTTNNNLGTDEVDGSVLVFYVFDVNAHKTFTSYTRYVAM
jgi:hypothetical protein